MADTRFSVPIPQRDMPTESYKGNFKGTLSFVRVDPKAGRMEIALQVLMPGFNYDLSHAGCGPSHGWFFFTCYNSEEAHTLLEVNASMKDKDFIAAIDWRPKKPGVYPFYCTGFCSALHQEMQGYIRVSLKDAVVPLKSNIPGVQEGGAKR